ncbi:MAG: holo-ACP synthase [Halothiobacillus sp.]
MGTDLVEIERLARAYARHGERLLARMLSKAERTAAPAADSPRFAAWLAKRFAAKEAAVKALGTGFRDGITLHDIETIHTPLGAPVLCFSGEALHRFHTLGGQVAHLTVSDERLHALAFVVIEGQLNATA